MLYLVAHNNGLKQAARLRLGWLAVLSSLLVVGCSEEPKPTGKVTQPNDDSGDGDDDSGDGDGDDESGDGDGDGDTSADGDGDGDGDGDVDGDDGNEFEELDGGIIIDNDGGVHKPVDDAGTGSKPAPTDGGKWTLKKGSAPECPKEPPPIPLLGGLCVGVYWGCGWENEKKEQYSCTCDWIHYLCLPL